MNINEILGYSAYDGIEYQTGEGTKAPTFIYADADYEVGDGKCGLHETAKQANEPVIVYVRADSFLSLNEWLQDRIDILAVANSWKTRAEKAEAENTRLRAALANSELPCVYCTLPKDEWSKCPDGFPGCGRADDAMGCPELGARMEAEEWRERAEAAEAKVARLREALGDLLSWFPDEQPKPKWELPAGEHGADDAIEAALKAMEATDE